jgi:hypothetical protein
VQKGTVDTTTPVDTIVETPVATMVEAGVEVTTTVGAEVAGMTTVARPDVVTVKTGGAGGAPASPPATNPPEVVNSPSTFTLRGVTFA